jgi:hypothetical protein
VRDLEHHPGAVARARVAARRAAVGQPREDLERLRDGVMRGATIESGDEAEPAGVVLVVGIVEALGWGSAIDAAQDSPVTRRGKAGLC